MPREESNCSSFFGALCFRYEVYNFLHKGNLSWEAILIIEGRTNHQEVSAAYHKEPKDLG